AMVSPVSQRVSSGAWAASAGRVSVLMPVVYHAASRALVPMGQDYAPLSTARPAVLRLPAASVAGSAPGVAAGLLPTSFAPLHRPASLATVVSASASGG